MGFFAPGSAHQRTFFPALVWVGVTTVTKTQAARTNLHIATRGFWSKLLQVLGLQAWYLYAPTSEQVNIFFEK